MKFLLLFAAAPAVATSSNPIVDISGLGEVEGIASSEHVAAFLAIPYAAPPVGKLRWQPPQPHGPWHPQKLNGTVFGNRCMQTLPGTTPDSEDCLFLVSFIHAPNPSCFSRCPYAWFPTVRT